MAVDKYMAGRNDAAMAFLGGMRAEYAVANLLTEGEEGKDISQLDLRDQGFCAATFNIVLNQAIDDEARVHIIKAITDVVTPANLQWLEEHRERPEHV